MIQPIKCKFHSTSQFRNVVKHHQEAAKYKGLDLEGLPILDPLGTAPKITYIGTTKLHGTNASIILSEEGIISFHSKNNTLGFMVGNKFTLLSDNAEFAQTMSRRFVHVQDILKKAKEAALFCNGKINYPLKVSGEWCGQGIQNSVGVSHLKQKTFFIFGIKNGETNQKEKSGWLPVSSVINLTDPISNMAGFYSITDFATKEVTIDFQNPEFSQNYLVESTAEVESSCPVATTLNTKDEEGNLQQLGEGLVWTPKDKDLCWDSGTWFKTKGEKHSVSKTKSVASIDPEELNSIKEFVEYAVTENRLQQGLSEVGKDTKLIGTFIGWINKDINKEEGDVIDKNGLSMKKLGKYLAVASRTWYINELNKY
jgi:predicted restriction endonuclease